MTERYVDAKRNVSIVAGGALEIGRDVTFGRNIDIRVIEDFVLGDRSHLGDDVRIRARGVSFGNDLWHSRGLDVGGGGCDRPRAYLFIGDRCTIHDNHLNLAESITILDDVGLSPAVTLYCHYFWKSVLEGFPAKMAPISIDNWAIIGYRTTILPGVHIGNSAVVGAHSVVTKDIEPRVIAAGNPAKIIKKITVPSHQDQVEMLLHIIEDWREIAQYHGLTPTILGGYPIIQINECFFDVKTLAFWGVEDECTDDWRDHARRYGLRFYGERPFKSALEWPE